jgi:hypothetical protein
MRHRPFNQAERWFAALTISTFDAVQWIKVFVEWTVI